MIRFNLAEMAKRQSNIRRKVVTIRDIAPPAVMATDLFQSYKPVLALIDRYAALATAEYDRSLSALITDSGDDLTNIFERMGQELTSLVLVLRPALRSWALRVERWNRDKFRGAVLSATSVDLQTMIGPEDVATTLDTAINWNVALVRDIGDQARQRISSAVFSGLTNRSPARDVAKQIRESTGMARDRSLRVASDQLSKISSSLADERRRAAGIATWEWVHSQKAHPRAAHIARNGHIYSDDAADIGGVIDGKTVEPVPATRPGQEPYCGCRARAVISFD
ncbi:phage minor head protein [Sphingomonas faeni]|uniref:phage minor head protein n=1 Tax=Sphingomonas faeni TaxID=185950 RepID=UPI0033519E22